MHEIRIAVRPRLRQVAAVAAALCLVGAAAACGATPEGKPVASLGDTAASPAASAGATAKDREAALLDFAKCMRTNGVSDFPDPTVDADGNPRLAFGRQNRDDPTIRKAQEACQSKLAAARPQFNPEQRQKLQDALLAYAKCMRDNGYQMADPTLGGTPGQRPQGGPFGDVNRNDPNFKKADPICRAKLGELGNLRGGGRPQ